MRFHRGIPILEKEKVEFWKIMYAQQVDLNLLVWNDKTESHIWWDLVFPLSKKIARNRRIVLSDLDTNLEPAPDNIYPVISIDCSSLTIDRFRSFVRMEQNEPLWSLFSNSEQDKLIYFHSAHQTAENLQSLISSVLDRRLGHPSANIRVIISSILDDTKHWVNVLNPSNIDKCCSIFLESNPE